MSSPSSAILHPHQNKPIWSRSERAIPRPAFDAALGRELHELMQEVKQMASQIKQLSDLWELEHHLNQRRKEIPNTNFAIRGLRSYWQTLARKATQRAEAARSAGGQAEVDPFFPQILSLKGPTPAWKCMPSK